MAMLNNQRVPIKIAVASCYVTLPKGTLNLFRSSVGLTIPHGSEGISPSKGDLEEALTNGWSESCYGKGGMNKNEHPEPKLPAGYLT